MNDTEIEYLPTIGEALNIKTVKQGRKHSLADTKKELIKHSIKASGSGLNNKQLNDEFITLTCLNVLKNKYATQAQKNLVQVYLDGIDKSLNIRYKILNIAKNINRKQ